MKWYFRIRSNQPKQAPGCRHCGHLLGICAQCAGNFDPGRLCQACSFGRVCPTCQRHWTTV